MGADLIIFNIRTLYTPNQKPPIRGDNLNDLKTLDRAFIAIKDGVIIGLGSENHRDYLDEHTILH
ncbi:MAG: hypothetical protein IH571_07375, partial [Acholeplasmataceae bacterium]|nr:hypothetical protein [Acholeplasmataceae bacterium]